jgi:hypothetical protein
MLFMVVERFKSPDPHAIGERFARCGRMLPDGVTYHASWMETDGQRCFQIMEAPDRQTLQAWIDKWADLVDFEVSTVLPSTEFWAARSPR